jgi:hypothetical protein
MQFGPAMCCTSENSLENPADETLCRRWRDCHDISAARHLAKRHRRLVLEVAEIHRPSDLPWDDLIGEGQLGLMRAMPVRSRSRRRVRHPRNLAGRRHPSGIRPEELAARVRSAPVGTKSAINRRRWCRRRPGLPRLAQ